MSLIQQIDKDIKAAMMARDKKKLEALRAVKNALLVQRTEKGAAQEIDEETEIKLLKRLVKQRKEAGDLYIEQGRDDLAEDEKFQADIIESYLPEQLSEDQIKAIVARIVEETHARSMKDMGKVMGKATKELAGKADNKQVSAIVKQLLS